MDAYIYTEPYEWPNSHVRHAVKSYAMRFAVEDTVRILYGKDVEFYNEATVREIVRRILGREGTVYVTTRPVILKFPREARVQDPRRVLPIGHYIMPQFLEEIREKEGYVLYKWKKKWKYASIDHILYESGHKVIVPRRYLISRVSLDRLAVTRKGVLVGYDSHNRELTMLDLFTVLGVVELAKLLSAAVSEMHGIESTRVNIVLNARQFSSVARDYMAGPIYKRGNVRLYNVRDWLYNLWRWRRLALTGIDVYPRGVKPRGDGIVHVTRGYVYVTRFKRSDSFPESIKISFYPDVHGSEVLEPALASE